MSVQTHIRFPGFGCLNSKWKGGKTLTESGYIRITAGIYRDRLEHRVVTKVFTREYHVHHRDGVPWHNAPSNLKVYQAASHNKLSTRRNGEGRIRKTLNDISRRDLNYILSHGVSISPRIVAIIQENWEGRDQEVPF